jgi:hypothetical protein
VCISFPSAGTALQRDACNGSVSLEKSIVNPKRITFTLSCGSESPD